jgi:hypothetical protein
MAARIIDPNKPSTKAARSLDSWWDEQVSQSGQMMTV